MKVDNEDIEQVLALFDDEDRPYINIDYLIEKGIIEIENTKKNKGPVLKLGGKNE